MPTEIIDRMLSSDTHVIEPPYLWSERVGAEFKSAAPFVRSVDGSDYWIVGGKQTLSFAAGAQTGDRFEKPKELKSVSLFADVREGGYRPLEHLKDNESDGVFGSVLYPTFGCFLYSIEDGRLLAELCRAYNDWLADFCAQVPSRLKGVAMVCLDDVSVAVREVQRARDIGLSGVLIPTGAPADRTYDHPDYEPLWACAQDLGMPLSLHLGSNRYGAGGTGENLQRIRPTWFTIVDTWVKTSLSDMIFSGVFDRYPQIRVGSVEHELGWIPHFLNRLDYTYTQRQDNARLYQFRDGLLPSDLFRRNIFCSFQDDDLGIRERATIGIDGLMWGSDYPHAESTFPESRSIMGKRLSDVPPDERERILYTNVARLYGFDTAPSSSDAGGV